MVLCYHNISDNVNEDWNNVSITSDNFYKQMKYLKENFKIVGFEENIYDYGSVAITFDDGYREGYLNALPILEELQIPAIFFISTACIDSKEEIWCHVLSNLIINGDEKNMSLELDGINYKTSSLENRLNTSRVLCDLLKKTSKTKLVEYMNKIKRWAGEEFYSYTGNYPMMNTLDIREMAKHRNIIIGAHTVNHLSLKWLSLEEQEYEISTSKEKLSRIIGKKVEYFSYPFGGTDDYSIDTIKILDKYNFKGAFSTTKKHYTESRKYEIPRVCIFENDMYHFVAKLNQR